MPDDLIAFRIKRSDGSYLLALTSKTDQPVWVRSPKTAYVCDAETAVRLRDKLRRRGIVVEYEMFRTSVEKLRESGQGFVQPNLM